MICPANYCKPNTQVSEFQGKRKEKILHLDKKKNKLRCVYETQMPPVTNSIESHAYMKAFEK
jgi:hypothetical protein